MLEIGLALLVAFLNSLSMFLQKSGIKKMFFSLKWILGTFLNLVSFFVYLLALKSGRLVIVQPLINASIVFLIILEIIYLKSKIKKYEIFSLFLFFLGLIIMQVSV
jgi:uncharacterized membrane protein